MTTVQKWIGISGSWRATSPAVEDAVRTTVRSIIAAGNGIVTGGALNVDYQATDEVMKLQKLEHLKVILPTSLTLYAAHYRKRAQEGVITAQQAEDLIAQLSFIKEHNPQGLIENKSNTVVNQDTYYARNMEVVQQSDELVAFQVNKSAGAQDTIDKARAKGIPVHVHTYTIA